MTSTKQVKDKPLSLQRSMQINFRRKRSKHFTSLLEKVKPQDGKTIHILDVGGTEQYWKLVGFKLDQKIKITLLNLVKAPIQKSENLESVQGNALDLSEYNDQQFDIAFSNSVIEHVGDITCQRRMAEEFRRVAKNYYIQTPNYHFFFEPHFRFPFIQFFPVNVRAFLVFHFRQKGNNKTRARERVMGITLLTVNKMKKLFPEAELYKEKFFGMTKSITMYYFPDRKKSD
ncbi:MAG: methyltransferase domain-containing protein [Anditalea sp.]